MKALCKKIYLFIESFPERLYPFASEIEGRFVRGRASYMNAMAEAVEKYGPARIGYKLLVYRSVFHVIGSVIFIILATVVTQSLFDGDTALYVLMTIAIIALFVQEFYSHPRRFGQLRYKGVTDWLTWVVPMVVYISFFQ